MTTRTDTFNVIHLYDNGTKGQWETKFLILSEYDLKFKENADDTITRSTIHLNDIVKVERDEETDTSPTSTSEPNDDNNNNNNNNNQSLEISIDEREGVELNKTTTPKYLLKFKTRYQTGWIIEMKSEEQFDDWSSAMERKKGILRETDINPPPPPPQRGQIGFKSDYDLCEFFSNRKMLGEMWMIYAFIAYTIMLVLLFSLLWTKYVLPEKNIVEIPTMCHIISEDAEYLMKRNYNLNIVVSYSTTEGYLTNTMKQYCSGSNCPSKMVEKYPVGSDRECHYDEADPSYVFFDLSQMVRKRYTITFGVCAGLFAPWLILVVTMIVVRFKTFSKMMKNTFSRCFGCE